MTHAHYINPLMQYGKIEFDLIIESDILGNHRMGKKFNDNVSENDLIEDANGVIQRISTEVIEETIDDVIVQTPLYPNYDTNNDTITIEIDWPPSRRND